MYEHLDESAANAMGLSDDERAERMLIDRFILHERLRPIFKHVEFLRFAPRKMRASGLVVSGPPGSGKSMLAEAIRRRYPQLPATDGAPATAPILYIGMTGAKEAKQIYERILENLGIPDLYVGSRRERMTLKVCRQAQVKLLMLDEIQDVLSSTDRQMRIALETIRLLMNELSLPVVALGTEKAKQAMSQDPHLDARFTYRELPTWTQGKHLDSFLITLERLLPLKLASNLSAPENTRLLVETSKGILDDIVKLVTYAGAYAIEKGEEKVTHDCIKMASLAPPNAAIRCAMKLAAEKRATA